MNTSTKAEIARWQFLEEALAHSPEAVSVCKRQIECLHALSRGVCIDDVRCDCVGSCPASNRARGEVRAIKDAAADRILQDIEHLVEHEDVRRADIEHHRTNITSWARAGESLSSQLDEANDRVEGLENALRATLEVIEAYADDHNDERPTDVTAVLPLLRKWVGASAQTDMFSGPRESESLDRRKMRFEEMMDAIESHDSSIRDA